MLPDGEDGVLVPPWFKGVWLWEEAMVVALSGWAVAQVSVAPLVLTGAPVAGVSVTLSTLTRAPVAEVIGVAVAVWTVAGTPGVAVNEVVPVCSGSVWNGRLVAETSPAGVVVADWTSVGIPGVADSEAVPTWRGSVWN